MKRYGIVAITAALLLTAGCSSKPGAESQLVAQHQNEQTESEAADTAQPAETGQEETAVTEPSEDAAVETAKEEVPATKETKPAEQPKEEAKKETKKVAKTEKKVQEAVKKNDEVTKAVTDSIMDNNKDKTAEKTEQTKQLEKSIEQIRAQVKDLKQHADNNDSALMKETSSLIVQSWDAMKADVKASVPSMYDFLDEKITSLSGLKDADPIDQAAVLQVDYELYQSFRQLADKLGVS
ncbi:hypothetical protein [Paenibacillus kobensis]|uniref:hypothetical protein n=1 Tax=Paenibacillus kobensis TaxID=59841 RepID=UPI000FD862C9|nr:hypothetical protein [Paenibacillus kobensis]